MFFYLYIMADDRTKNSGRKKLSAEDKMIPITIYKRKSDIELLGKEDVREMFSAQFDIAVSNRRAAIEKRIDFLINKR